MKIYNKDDGLIELNNEEIRMFHKIHELFLHACGFGIDEELPEMDKSAKPIWEMMREFEKKFIITNLDE